MTARMRWLIGGGAVAAAAAIVVVALSILGARPTPEALRYVPSTSVAVAELRMDLPGDQLSRLGNLLAHFPGFQDQSTLAAKIDESLDRVIADASGGSVEYTAKVKPWLAGPAFVAVLPAPPSGPSPSPGLGAFSSAGGDGVVVATTNGQVSCDSVISGGTPRDVGQGSMLVAADGSMACFLDGRYGLLGTPSGVKAAVDAHVAGSGMDRDATYAQARNALAGDQLATLYVSGAAAGLMAAAASPAVDLPLPSGLADALPAWTMAGLRAEDDALVADLVVAPAKGGTAVAPTAVGSPRATMATLPPPRASQVAAFVPGNAIAVAEVEGAGIAGQNALHVLTDDPQFQSVAGQLGSALALAGGPEGLLGWIDDAAIVALPRTADAASGPAAPPVDGGLILVAADDATAASKASQLQGLLSSVALLGGGSVDAETVDGATVTTIDLGDLNALLGAAGGPGGLGGLTIPPGTHVTVSLATRGRLVLVGADVEFARSMLQVQAGGTLADQAAYRRAIARATERNIVQVYLAGDALRKLAGTLIPADQLDHWRTDLLPYAEPADAMLLTSTIDGGLLRSRLVLAVSTPAATPTSTP